MNNSIKPIFFTTTQNNVPQNQNNAYQNSNSPQPAINPYAGTPISIAEERFMFKENIQFQKNLAEEQMRQEYRKEIEKIKLENALKRDEAIFARKVNRELASMGIIEDIDGSLRSHLIFPGGDQMFSPPLLKVKHIKMSMIHSLEGEVLVQIVTWSNSDNQVILSGNNMTPTGLLREFGKKGVIFLVGRDRKKLVADMLYAFLCEHAEHKTMPEVLGWNKLDDEWIFAYNSAETIDGIRRGEKRDE